jgi:hypothetical protein
MEAWDMAALVRHDAMPADAGEIIRLYSALDTVNEAEFRAPRA